jgi:hypothetical protein
MYSKIDKRIQNDEKFRELGEREKLVFFLLLSHPHLSMIGAMRHTIPGMAAEFNMPPEGFRKAFEEVCSKGMVKHDEKASFVWLPNFLKYNHPQSPNVVKAWAGVLDLLPECDLKDEVLLSLKTFIEGMSEAFGKAFEEALHEDFSKAMPNQKQQQKQKQKQQQQQCLLPNAAAAAAEKLRLKSQTPAPSTMANTMRTMLGGATS